MLSTCYHFPLTGTEEDPTVRSIYMQTENFAGRFFSPITLEMANLRIDYPLTEMEKAIEELMKRKIDFLQIIENRKQMNNSMMIAASAIIFIATDCFLTFNPFKTV